MARITLPDGRWLDIRCMWVDDELAVEELGTAGTELESAAEPETAYKRYTGLLRQVKAMLDGAITGDFLGRRAGQMSRDDMLGLIARWREASEDDAVPPA